VSIETVSWEQNLIRQALIALESYTPFAPISAEQRQLEKAYAYCEDITREHSRTFYLASNLLPIEQKKAVRALYAFCRTSDDLVDEGGANKINELAEWRHRSLSNHPADDDLVALAWADARAKYNIPHRYAEQLLDGIAQDLTVTRYEKFADLAHYCYGVASTVGLMSMHIVGYSGEEAVPYAVKLGVALQLTNILRDVGEDWNNGRFYLPQEDLRKFKLRESDIAAGKLDNRWQSFMRFQIERTHRLYDEALPGIDMLGKQGRFAIGAAAELYRAILDDVEANHYDVFNRRAHVKGSKKLRKLPGIWWRSKIGSYA
jgi:phytoene synthase